METAGLSRTCRSGGVRPTALAILFLFLFLFFSFRSRSSVEVLEDSHSQMLKSQDIPPRASSCLSLEGRSGCGAPFTLRVSVSSSNTTESWCAIASAESLVSSVRP